MNEYYLDNMIMGGWITMKRIIIIILFVLLTVQIVIAKNIFSVPPIFNFPFNPNTQGGVLEFSSKILERYELSSQNSDSLVLRNYSGIPLKALQFKVIIGKDGGKLKFKSVSRGASIPASSFLLDYEIHKGELQSDGSSADVVSVVLLGCGTNVLLPGEIHHIISINYDVVNIESDNISTSLSLYDVVGATGVPIQDANIAAGEDQIIFLRKSSVMEKEKISLLQNYPNPFNPSTTIQFTLPGESFTKLEIFNTAGEKVSTLVSETLSAGTYEYEWNAEVLPSGIYLYRLQTQQNSEIRKMILIK